MQKTFFKLLFFSCSFLFSACTARIVSVQAPNKAGPSFAVSGVVQLGRVKNATVSFYSINTNGSTGSLIGSTSTNSSGEFSLSIPKQTGPVLVVSTGGTYKDEAEELSAPDKGASELANVLEKIDSAEQVPLTPLTTLVKANALENFKAGTAIALAKTIAEEKVAELLGLEKEDLRVLPAKPDDLTGSTLRQVKAAFAMSVLSHYLKQKAASSSITEVMTALGEDFKKDGKLDGRASPTESLTGSISTLAQNLASQWASQMPEARDLAANNTNLGFKGLSDSSLKSQLSSIIFTTTYNTLNGYQNGVYYLGGVPTTLSSAGTGLWNGTYYLEGAETTLNSLGTGPYNGKYYILGVESSLSAQGNGFYEETCYSGGQDVGTVIQGTGFCAETGYFYVEGSQAHDLDNSGTGYHVANSTYYLNGIALNVKPPFISTWKTDNLSNSSSGADQITLPLESTGTYQFIVDWGDGSFNAITDVNDPNKTHTYASPGTYTLKIYGTITGFSFAYQGDKLKILNISQFGGLRLGNTGYYFTSASNLTITATDPLDLTGTTVLTEAFLYCYSLTTIPSVTLWDVSQIEDMSYLFSSTGFNQDISSWNVSNVTNMEGMFNGASSFNQPIGSWNVARVTNMYRMFNGASSFNQPIGNWNTANVVNMSGMFGHAIHFNQPIGNWNTANVIDMSEMFNGASAFNQPIGSWNTSNVVYLDTMFMGASAFNQPLGNWNTGNNTGTYCMFCGATSFNQNLGSWNVTNVTQMASMFESSSLSRSNYDSILIGWSAQNVKSEVSLGADSTSYSAGNPSVVAARDALIAKGWTISDAGPSYPTISTIAGTGEYLNSGDGGPATHAKLLWVEGMARDRQGNIYLVQQDDGRIRRIDAVTGVISTFAGIGERGYSGDGGPANLAKFSYSQGLIYDSKSNSLFLSEYSSGVVRRIDLTTNVVSTVAGRGPLLNGYNSDCIGGDGGRAIDTVIQDPRGIAIDKNGNLFIADYGCNKIRKVNLETGIISTVAGNGASYLVGENGLALEVGLDHPNALAMDQWGNLYVGTGTWWGEVRVRKIDLQNNYVTTVMGTGEKGFSGDGGLAINAKASAITGLAVDSVGNIYIADGDNNVIRKVDSTTNIISTIAGTGQLGYSGDGARALDANLNYPSSGLIFDEWGNLYFADAGNSVIRKIEGVGLPTPSEPEAETVIGAPGTPTGLRVRPLVSAVGLRWNPPYLVGGSPLVDYVIQYKRETDFEWITFDDGVSSSQKATVTGLSLGVAYSFRVAAVNGSGQSAYSSVLGTSPRSPFISTWKTDNTNPQSSAGNQITLPLVNGGTYDFTVDWGDGSQSHISSWDSPDITHTYATSGTYTVTISGEITGFNFNFGGDAIKLLDISQFGVLRLGTDDRGYYFANAENLTITATDPLDLTGLGELGGAFMSCTSLTTAPSMESWDTRNVKSFWAMFSGATNFNQPIGNWNVSNALAMGQMFSGAQNFNQPIGNWNVSNVTSMGSMFQGASSFNQPIGNWDVSNVIYMSNMFRDASSFNQPLGNWNVSNVTDISGIFQEASSFNQPLGNWNIANVTNMQSMFMGASLSQENYDATLMGWGSQDVKTGVYFDAGAAKYSPSNPLVVAARDNLIQNKSWTINDGGPGCPSEGWCSQESTYYIGGVAYPGLDSTGSGYVSGNSTYYMFGLTTTLDSSGNGTWLGQNYISGVINSTPFISTWKTDNTSDGSSESYQVTLPLEESGTYRIIVDWGDGSQNKITAWNDPNKTHGYSSPGIYTVTIIGNLVGFNFNGSGDRLKITNISQFGSLRLGNNGSYFSGAQNLTITATDPLDLTGTNNLSGAFALCSALTTVPSMAHWETENVTNMSGMFSSASAFNQPIGSWNTANVTNMSGMFSSASAFNQPIGSWNTANVTSMYGMFTYASAFNQPIGNWNTENVTDMSWMFANNTTFNQPIGNWNTSKVTDISSMFASGVGRSPFDQDISDWNTANVTSMNYTFYNSSFNQPIGSWNTANVTDMTNMFGFNFQFNQNISNWNTGKVTSMYNMFYFALAFNQNVGSWNVSNVTDMTTMFGYTALSQANYNAILLGWGSQNVMPNVPFGSGQIKYSLDNASVVAARNNLIQNKGWTISDGGGDLTTGSDFYSQAQSMNIGTETNGPDSTRITLQYANGSGGFKIWKEKNGSRILNATGLLTNGWQKKLNRAGTGFDGDLTDSSVIEQIEGRVCPPNVFLDHDHMTATGRCLYYDSGNAAQRLDDASPAVNGTSSSVEGEDYISSSDSSSSGRGSALSYYEGNIKTCADKGMRLPTVYETQGYTPEWGLPTGDLVANGGSMTGAPVWAGNTTGVPILSSATWSDSTTWYWTATARNASAIFWACSGFYNRNAGWSSDSLSVRCVLPSSN